MPPISVFSFARAAMVAGVCLAFSFSHAADRFGADAYRLRVKPGTHAPLPPPAAAETVKVEFVPSPRLQSRPFAKIIAAAAENTSLDPVLVHAVISVESGYNPAARSSKGALGLMQVLPETGARYGIKNVALSPAANVRAGTRYLKDLMDMFDRRLDLVLAAYNAGEGAVIKYGERIPPFRETQHYVPTVLARYKEWREPKVLPAVDSLIATPGKRVYVQYMAGTGLDPEALQAAGFR